MTNEGRKPDFRPTSSQISFADRKIAKSRLNEPTGQAESLHGRISLSDFGSRVVHEKPDAALKVEAKRLQKTEEQKKEGIMEMEAAVGGGMGGLKKKSLLDAFDKEKLIYRPRTKETRNSYELLLGLVHSLMGDVPDEVAQSAADDIIGIMKKQNAPMRDADKRNLVTQILGIAVQLSSDAYGRMVGLADKLVDYVDPDSSVPGANEEGAISAETGVSVVFEEEEDGDAEEEEEENELDGLLGNESDLEQEETTDKDVEPFDPREVDAYWLQRQISQFFPDPSESLDKSNLVFQALESINDSRELENKLVLLLDYANFNLIKLLTLNQYEILHCIKMAKMENKERLAYEEQLSLHHKGMQLLKSLKGIGPSIQFDLKHSADMAAPMEMENKESIQTVDLDSLAFEQGSHLMSNKMVAFHSQSKRITRQGFEEIHIPAPLKPQVDLAERIVSISEMPQWTHSVFKGTDKLNKVQSALYDKAFLSEGNLLLCAPTGAGKTNVALLAILNEMSKHLTLNNSLNLSAFKIVYIAPMKALVSEVVGNFSARLKDLGVAVAELTGDRHLSKKQIMETQVIVTTPEKWDVITRKNNDNSYTRLVRLVIIDEIHLLHDERGPVLESIIARTLRQVEQTQEAVRLVGLSATLPNYEDVGRLLRADKDCIFFFDARYRPVPLQQQFIGINEKKAYKRMTLMNEILYEKVLEQMVKNQQVLVFVHSRKETVKTAKILLDTFVARQTVSSIMSNRTGSIQVLKNEAENLKNLEMKELLPMGIGVHHAGMSRTDRTLMEDLFADRHLQVLVSTSTLAWGVNLPAHTVIIKGTLVYSPEKGQWMELSMQDVLQMFGRAGRPQYDTEGLGIIITTLKEMNFYLSLLNEQLPVESQMMSKLVEHLNAEVVLGSIKSLEDGIEWLKYTYLYLRMLKDPQLYLGSVNLQQLAENDPYLTEKRKELIHSAAIRLDKAQMIKYDFKSKKMKPTYLGKIAAHYYLNSKSMATLNSGLKAHLNDIDIFKVFSLSSEFSLIPVREDEKIELSKMIERVPIPIKESVEVASTKVNVLLQSYISHLKMDGFALQSDMVYVAQSASRIFRAMFEVAVKNKWARLSLRLLDLSKSVEKRMWISSSPLRQFTAQHSATADNPDSMIPFEVVRKLERKDFPFGRLFDLTVQEVGELLKIGPKMSRTVHKLIHQFPKMELSATIQPITRSTLKIQLSMTPQFDYDPFIHGNSELFWVFVSDADNENFLFVDQFLLRKQYASRNSVHLLDFTVSLSDIMPPHYFIQVVSDRWIQAETKLAISFRHLVLPEKSVAPNAVLDLMPLDLQKALEESLMHHLVPIAASKANSVTQEKIQEARRIIYEFVDELQIKQLNAMQTQVYSAAFNSKEDLLVCAPEGSGKKVILALTILRHYLMSFLMDSPLGKIVYIKPFGTISNFNLKFLKVGQLAGEVSNDLRTLESNDLVLATPSQWDALSRRWKQRKAVQAVRLLLAAQLHLVGGWKDGHVYEVVISRMRYLKNQLEENLGDDYSLRMVGCCASIASSRDAADWLGATGANQSFSFDSTARPFNISMEILPIFVKHVPSMVLHMNRPIFDEICEFRKLNDFAHSERLLMPERSTQFCNVEGVCIFVEKKENAKDCAADLLSFFYASRMQIVDANQNEYPELAEDMQYLISNGIGILYSGQSKNEALLIKKLFGSRMLNILILTREMIFLVDNVKCGMGIIAGTCYYDGKQHRYLENSLSEMQAMSSYIGIHGCMNVKYRLVVMTSDTRAAFYTKFMNEPMPLESHLDGFLHDHLVNEVATKTIENKQEAVDYLTWTFLYRRLAKNPNFYGMSGNSQRHQSEYLSELIESVVLELVEAGLIEAVSEDEFELAATNLGMISAYYSVNYLTVEMIGKSLMESTKLKGILEIVSAASEFMENLKIRGNLEADFEEESRVLGRLMEVVPLRLQAWMCDFAANHMDADPCAKANLMIQSHLMRLGVTPEMEHELHFVILPKLVSVLYAVVDVASSNGWLSTCLVAMEMCQMAVQAVFDRESPLKQLPHFDKERIQAAKDMGVHTVFDVLELNDEKRQELLKGLSKSQVSQVAAFANRYPSVDLEFSISAKGQEMEAAATKDKGILTVLEGEAVVVCVNLDKGEDEEDEEASRVICPYYPLPKEECWWIVVARKSDKSLLAIKRVSMMKRRMAVRLEFVAEALVEVDNEVGRMQRQMLNIYLMCDSYVGADQEYEGEICILKKEATEMDREDMLPVETLMETPMETE